MDSDRTIMPMNDQSGQPAGFGDLIRTFLRISLLGFGGPNAHIALMLDEVVDRKGWITRQHFMHLVAATNLLPGPNSSEVAIHIGYTQRGWRGAFATGLSFLLPTLIMVTVLSALYFSYGSLPSVEGIFWGLKPAVLAVILAAGWKLGKTALGFPEHLEWHLFLLALGGIGVAFFYSGSEVPAMAAGGLLTWLLFKRTSGVGGPGTPPRPAPKGRQESKPSTLALPFALPPAAASGMTPVIGSGLTSSLGASGFLGVLGSLGSLPSLFLLTLGAGAVLFGGGYMLVALIEPFVVESAGWLTADQFLDGIALTQAVPGPIVTLVAFVGYGVAGVPGAIVATAGIYIPSFMAVLAVAPHLEKWRQADGFRAALKGVNAVVAGAILGVGFSLLPPAVPDRWAAGLFLISLLALVRFRAKALWVVAGGLLAGVIHFVLIR